MPLVPVLADIERNGFLLDVEGLRTLSKEAGAGTRADGRNDLPAGRRRV